MAHSSKQVRVDGGDSDRITDIGSGQTTGIMIREVGRGDSRKSGLLG